MQSHGWQARAACLRLNVERFFDRAGNIHGRVTPETSLRRWQAKQVCAGCPVVRECLTHAENTEANYGVYGGLDQKERALVRQRTPARTAMADLVKRLRLDGLSWRRIGELVHMNADQAEHLYHSTVSTASGRMALREYQAWFDVADGFAPVTISRRHSLPMDKAEEMCEAMDENPEYDGPTGEDRRVGRTAVAH